MSFAEDVTDLICPVCFGCFHDPIILNCGHTIDRLCVQKLVESICPLCYYAFDPEKPFVSNQSVTKIIRSEPTFEWFLIDISSDQQRTNVLTFLRLIFTRRDISETNQISFQTADERIIFNSSLNFDQELKIKPLLNLEQILQEIYGNLQEQNGLRKICILTDGSADHLNVTKIDSNKIKPRFIIHVGDKNIARTRQLANRMNFQFGHFNDKTLEIYVEHFLLNY